jgi:tetratricopeptide (TPR) repeat protein
MTALVEKSRGRRLRLVLLGALIATLTILAYLPALWSGFIWDDDRYVTDNPLLTASDGLRRIWFSLDSPSQYFPLTYTSFRIERTLWGVRPFGYHLTNLLLHLANALLLWRLLAQLKIPGAWLAAGIFALHPVQVESVAWVAERKNVLMAFFLLLTLLSWVAFMNGETRRRWLFYTLSLLLYALALAAKTTACTLPAVLFLILWLQRKPITRARILQIVPFVLLGLLLGLVTIWWERFHQGTEGAEFAIGMRERVIIASHAIWFYAGKLIWPSALTFIYPRWQITPSDPVSYGWLAGLIFIGVLIYLARRRAGRGLEVGLAFFVITLGPVLGFIMLYTFRYKFVADHYQYVASIGLIAIFAAAVSTMASKIRSGRYLEIGAGILLFLVLGALTWRQANIYKNMETVWRDTLIKNPGCWLAEDNLGLELLRQRRFDEALVHSRQATVLKPNYAPAENDLGNVYFRMGALNEAVGHFEKALEIDPKYISAHNNLGNAFQRSGRTDEAIGHYLKALEVRQDVPETYNNLAIAYRKRGQPDEAVRFYEKALSLKPDSAETHYNLANALLQLGRRDEATAHLREAVRIKPDFPEARRVMQRLDEK